MYKIIVFTLAFIASQTVFADWGAKGHRATAAIAQQYLSKKAKKNIKKLLGDETLITASTYADEIKSNPKYRKYNSWHYVNIPDGETYATSTKNENGDLIQAIRTCESVLSSKTSSKEEKVFYLKFLIHLMGDLHQPLHCGRAEDKGGNDIQVRWYNTGTNLHSVWDTKMIESYGMSYSELMQNYAPKDKEIYKEFSQGSLLDWVAESRTRSQEVYASVEIGQKLRNDYLYDHLSLVTQQLEKGGVRLAHVLNTLFG